MGRSAKLHKRSKKSAVTNKTTSTTQSSKPASATPTVQEQKKKAGLKAKAGKRRADGDEEPILGGADYVELMLGSRRKAMEEASKLPQSP